ncbi:D-alanine--D-alanine ligase B [Rickettsiales bacterium Ac37b]|nr:D-alanine--D-alanine ligase B [Rickettsiales bacterium Ac37b]
MIKSVIYSTFIPQTTPSTHVVVLMGGISTERDISLSSATGIIESLKKLHYKVTPVDMGRDIAQVLLELKPDVVFNALHGGYGENGCIAGLLEILNIPYTHSGILASSIGMNKLQSINIFAQHGIKAAPHIIINKHSNLTIEPMKRPYVIKPISEGSSIGIHIVLEQDNFNIRDYDFPYGDEVLVEQYIPGQEIQVAIINNKAIGALEIIPKGKFYDYQAKYTDGLTEHIIPASLSSVATQKVLSLAEKAHNALGCRGISRVEFRYNSKEGDDGFYILEINTHPGMTPLSIVPEIASYHGITYSDIVKFLVEDALDYAQTKQ